MIRIEKVEIGELKEIDAEKVHYLYHKAGNPMKEARMIEELMEIHDDQKKVAKILGVTQSHVSKRLRLLSLNPILQNKLLNGELRPSTAYALTNLPDKIQAQFLDKDKITLKEVETKRRQQNISPEFLKTLTAPFPELNVPTNNPQGFRNPTFTDFVDLCCDAEDRLRHILKGNVKLHGKKPSRLKASLVLLLAEERSFHVTENQLSFIFASSEQSIRKGAQLLKPMLKEIVVIKEVVMI